MAEPNVSECKNKHVTFAFWNMNRRERHEFVVKLVAHTNADVVILAEHGADRNETLAMLRSEVDESFTDPISDTPRLQLFSRRESLGMREVYGDASGRVTIRAMYLQQFEFLVAAVHLPSKRVWNGSDQTAETEILARQIGDEEERRGHSRTILVGDLNMNPFDDGLVLATGLHAMMTKTTAVEKSRVVQRRAYPFFYNPMWGFFGDRTSGPPGTHYYRHSGHLSYEWNIFDQVLIRPDALPWFQDDIAIITTIGETELTDANGRPNKDLASDHFPIVFRLALAPQ